MSDIPLIGDRLFDELDQAQAVALENQPVVEPTKDEKRNGWTAEALTDYLAERSAGQEVKADPFSVHRKAGTRPSVQNTGYSPHRWR
jgi:hypothetical protein